MTRRSYYMVGDEVSVNVTIGHMANLLSVDLIYVWNQDSGVTLTLTGAPEEVVEDYVARTGWRSFKAQASEEVGIEHQPGEYVLSRIELYTAGGQTLVYDPQDHSTVETDHYWLIVGSEDSYARIYLSLEDKKDEDPK